MSKINEKMKKFNLRGVLDGLRSSVSTPPKGFEWDIEETLRSEHFQLAKTIRHGFPYQPTAMAYDPVQKLLAIGTKSGSLRIFGRPGVDCHVRHETEVAVLQILVLVNEGALVSVCDDEQLHLWSLRQKRPEIVHSLKFQRERITFCHLPFQSKWLYIGTERGNVHVANIESFALSGYIINWNKAIELARKTHPGPVVHLSDCPIDSNKLLIGFESGSIVLWDLRSKSAEYRYSSSQSLKSVSWHNEGKQFICSHGDGGLSLWNVKNPQKPQNIFMPHAKIGKDGKPEPCRPITKVEWRSVRNGEPYIIFSGGMPCDKAGRTPCLTVMHAKNTTVLEMEHNVVDFLTLCSTPWKQDFQDPFGIVVLLQNDLVLVDLTSPGYPCFENPYPMDIHESPVTTCLYFADCPPDLIPAFYSVGSKQKKTGFSEREWPVKGGEWGTTTCSYSEIIVTGHADGSVKFWDASAVTLQVLYKLKTAKLFDKSKCKEPDPDDDPFAIQHLFLCPESRLLGVAGFTHVILFKFSKQDTNMDCVMLEIPIVYEIYDELDSPELEYPPVPPKPSIGSVSQQSGSLGSYSSTASDGKDSQTSVRVKSGCRKWSPGYQPDLTCVLQWTDGEPPPPITKVSFNSRYGLLAFGNECGIAVVDFVQKTCLLNMGTPDLYGSMDPYSRAPRSPKNKNQLRPLGCEGTSQSLTTEDCKSPTADQQTGISSSPTASPQLLSPVRRSHHPPAVPMLERIQESLGRVQQSAQCSAPPGDSSVRFLDQNHQQADRESPKFQLGSADPHESSVVFETSTVQGQTSPFTNVSLIESFTTKESKVLVPVGGAVSAESSTGVDSAVTPVPPSPVLLLTDTIGQSTNADKQLIGRTKSAGQIKDAESISKPSTSQAAPKKQRRWSVFTRKKGIKTDDTLHPEYNDQPTLKTLDLSQTWHNVTFKTMDNNKTLKVEQESQTLGNKTFRSEGDLSHDGCHGDQKASDKTNNNVSVHNDIQPPASAPILSNDESKSLLRRMSQKIRKSLAKKTEECDEAQASRDGPWFEIVDLTSDEVAETPVVRKINYITHCQMDKGDGSFSRSRSSSMSSLENIRKEAILTLVFGDVYTNKTDSATCPCLWVGTSMGSVLVISLHLPPEGDARKNQPVIVSPSGTIFRLRGAILAMSFLDYNGILIPAVADQWKDLSRAEENKTPDKKVYTRQQSMSSMRARMSPTASTEQMPSDRQFAIMCSEKQARVVSLPSQMCAYKVKITETSTVAIADVVSLKDSVYLACYITNGHVMTFSLPTLKPLLDVDYMPLTDIRIAKTFCFSSNGHGLYFCTPTEVQKITLSAEVCESLKEMLGELFLPCETPEPPKQSFIKNLFGGGAASLDRQELFGESSGKASKGVARYTAGTAGMSQAQDRSALACSEIGRAKLAALERGERLGELEDRTVAMRLEAEEYTKSTHELMLKYKNKKWYQF